MDRKIQSNCANPNLTFLGLNLATKTASLEKVKGSQNKKGSVQSSTEIT
jgi:hypothetical protein